MTFTSHANRPAHWYVPGMTFIVTAGTYMKFCLFDTPEKKTLLQETIFEQCRQNEWGIHGWAILSNHYHLIISCRDDESKLPHLIISIHSASARKLNQLDGMSGRKVWYQYWDKLITYEKSYFARLNYVHHNPVHHRVIGNAELYPWCSMGWFVNNAPTQFRRKVLSFPYERIKIEDNFDV